jgi:hypothetical protein
MNVCAQCGSGSRDKDGICAGCGTAWPLELPDQAANQSATKHASSFHNLPGKISSAGLMEVRPKLVWVAVLLALTSGPLGLLYCTVPGAIVMLFASVLLYIVFGQASTLIVLPICALWAWKAARESASIFD